jgi:hypothetical protein
MRNLTISKSGKCVEGRILRGIFGPKREEITAEWIKLHD